MSASTADIQHRREFLGPNLYLPCAGQHLTAPAAIISAGTIDMTAADEAALSCQQAWRSKLAGDLPDQAARDWAAATASILELAGYRIDGLAAYKQGQAVDLYVGCVDAEPVLHAARAARHLIGSEPAAARAVLDQAVARLRNPVVDEISAAVLKRLAERGVPVSALHPLSDISLLGWGRHQRRFFRTTTGELGNIASKVAHRKGMTNALLSRAGVPVARQIRITSLNGLLGLWQQWAGPLVLKPGNGHRGDNVFIGLNRREELEMAYRQLAASGATVLAEQFIAGHSHRFLVINGTVVAAARLTPAHVVGDGVRDVRQLIEAFNADPRCGSGPDDLFNHIRIDGECQRFLAAAGAGLETVLAAGQSLQLRGQANISTGGRAENVLERVHPDNLAMAALAASVVGVDVAGVDIISTDIREPWYDNAAVVCEINTNPGLRPHFQDPGDVDVLSAYIDHMAPPGDGRIPLIAVTGTNGKTTTSTLIAEMFRQAGSVTGRCGSDGVFVDGQRRHPGDRSGPRSCRALLTDPSMAAVVAEVARGGILREGLGFDRCQVAVVTNIGRDHLGEDGVETVDALARVKRVVADSASDAVVLNAADDYCTAMAETGSAREVAWFAAEEAAVRRACAARPARLCGYLAGDDAGDARLQFEEDGKVMLQLSLGRVPVTLGGHSRVNALNGLAAALAARAAGLPWSCIEAGLTSLAPGPNSLRGRMMPVAGFHCDVVLDYAHNEAGFEALADYMSRHGARRCIGVLAFGANRPADFYPVLAAKIRGFDHILLTGAVRARALPGAQFRQSPEWVVDTLAHGLLSAGLSEAQLDRVADQAAAIEDALALADSGDLVVVVAADVGEGLQTLNRLKQQCR